MRPAGSGWRLAARRGHRSATLIICQVLQTKMEMWSLQSLRSSTAKYLPSRENASPPLESLGNLMYAGGSPTSDQMVTRSCSEERE